MQSLTNFFKSPEQNKTPTPENNIYTSPNAKRNFQKANRKKRKRLLRNKNFREKRQQQKDDILPCTVEGQSTKPIDELSTLQPKLEIKEEEGYCIIC